MMHDRRQQEKQRALTHERNRLQGELIRLSERIGALRAMEKMHPDRPKPSVVAAPG